MVVGGGRAGQDAARAAAERGASTLLLDEDPIAPALVGRNVPYWFGGLRPPRSRVADARLDDLAALADAGVDVLAGTSAWAVFADGTVGLFDGARTWLVRAGEVVLATGTVDLALPLPGWTLGGVFGACAALAMAERAGTLGVERLVVVGDGALARRVGDAAQSVGTEVVATVDGVRERVLEMRGAARVSSVIATSGGQRSEIVADGVCVAIGRQPATELAEIAGCALVSHGLLRGVRHDERGTTSRANIRVVGALADNDATAASARAFDAALGAIDLADGTTACACEEVSAGRLRDAIRVSDGDLDEAKRRTRVGMGPCQGRRCLPVAMSLIAHAYVRPSEGVARPRFRPPARPVPISALATEEDVAIPRSAPFAHAEERLIADAHADRVSPFAIARFDRRAEELQLRLATTGASEAEAEQLARALESEIRAAATRGE